MKNFRTLLTSALLLSGVAVVQAQDISWDKEKYPDYNPTPRVNQVDISRMSKRIKKQTAEGKKRPDYWNNALSSAFPPVMNQSAGSCGSASRIYYMFTHEMNASRWADGSKAENIYPTHFTWLLTWTPGGQGKEVIAQHNGVPNSAVYGGYTYSDVFGYQDCDDGQSNYGWMQGYDKWLHAMNNRITGAANFPSVDTEEGRELVKNYLWNHCGDETYSTGGIVGVGVAASLTTGFIGNTTANKAAGVVGMYYVKNWGATTDHALTIVGYDDRIEFDLDGNGVYGETDKDEVGAWIIVNSWGTGFCNGGFVYCPYAEARPVKDDTSYWGPEYYTARRDYRPLRTLKVKMDYSHRSEMALYVGVAKDLNATAPEKETWLRHFYYSGLGKGVTVNAENPDPAIPMLGKWADGNLHTEPMEFGYDLTDLVSDYENGQPLKYFFRVETRAWAQGTGKIYNASIIDYTTDREGVEIPFDIAADGQAIANAGKKTTITTTARYENIPTPRNLSINGTELEWQEPADAPYAIKAYKIYQGGELLQSVEGTVLNATVSENGTYAVAAVYQIGNNEYESQKSSPIMAGTAATPESYNILNLTNAQFTVPAFSTGGLSEFTIELWLYASSFTDKCCGIKASSGKFLFYVDKDGKVVAGFDGGDFRTSTKTLTRNKWQQIAIVVKGNSYSVYKTTLLAGQASTEQLLSYNSVYNSGIGGNNDLWFGKTEDNTRAIVDALWTGQIADLRIWNTARTQTKITANCADLYVVSANYPALTHYYQMNTRERGDGTLLLVNDKGQNDATFTKGEGAPESNALTGTAHPHGAVTSSAKFSWDVDVPAVGQPVTLIDESSPSTSQWTWTIPGADVTTSNACNPVVVFTEAGDHQVELSVTNIKGKTATYKKKIVVVDAEMPVADFRISAETIAAGEHISFINTSTPLDKATYTWTLEGAEVEILNSINAAATYPATGTYTVRLEAKTAAGSDFIEKQINVVKVAPQSAFTIQNNVVLVNEPINLIDATKYEPETWDWMIANQNHTYITSGQKGSIKLPKPGIYDVTLTTSNEKGSSKINRSRAITVCNADGQTGLNFDNADDEVVSGTPLTGTVLAFTVEWWMYPGTINSTCCRMGDSESTFLLTTESDRSMKITINNKTAQTSPAYVIENEWHHYAVTYSGSSSTATFYRDGEVFGTVKPASSYAAWKAFTMGGADGPMNAIVDELRIWRKALSAKEVRQYANEPIADPESITTLKLYYDFNQSTGDVIDRSASNLTGTRNNFGPDGDAWTSSRGIFYLDFDSEATDVTKTYLKNYVAPFATGSGYVNTTTANRFKKLAMGTTASPWVQENSVVENGITTEFHVDANKSNYLTLATTHDSFASEVKNLKLYQTITLPAGAYEFGSWSDKEYSASSNYLVAAAGTGLPDYADLSSKALGYARSSTSCKFILTEETTVSLGILSMMSGRDCHTVKLFALQHSPVTTLEMGEIVDKIEAVEDEVIVTPDIQAMGGLGVIKIIVGEPQEVRIYSLSGQLVWQNFVNKEANARLRRGIYIVGQQKTNVR